MDVERGARERERERERERISDGRKLVNRGTMERGHGTNKVGVLLRIPRINKSGRSPTHTAIFFSTPVELRETCGIKRDEVGVMRVSDDGLRRSNGTSRCMSLRAPPSSSPRLFTASFKLSLSLPPLPPHPNADNLNHFMQGLGVRG